MCCCFSWCCGKAVPPAPRQPPAVAVSTAPKGPGLASRVFEGAKSAVQVLAPHLLKQACNQVFEEFDKNRDGELDASELKALLDALGGRLPPLVSADLTTALEAISVEEVMTLLDTDNSGTLSKEEFACLTDKLLKWARDPSVSSVVKGLADGALRAMCEELFNRYDQDNDGELTKPEVQAMVKELVSSEFPRVMACGTASEQQEFMSLVTEEFVSKLDSDGSGTLNKVEFKDLVSKLEGKVGAHKRKKLANHR